MELTMEPNLGQLAWVANCSIVPPSSETLSQTLCSSNFRARPKKIHVTENLEALRNTQQWQFGQPRRVGVKLWLREGSTRPGENDSLAGVMIEILWRSHVPFVLVRKFLNLRIYVWA